MAHSTCNSQPITRNHERHPELGLLRSFPLRYRSVSVSSEMPDQVRQDELKEIKVISSLVIAPGTQLTTHNSQLTTYIHERHPELGSGSVSNEMLDQVQHDELISA